MALAINFQKHSVINRPPYDLVFQYRALAYTWLSADEHQLEDISNEDGTIENEHSLSLSPIVIGIPDLPQSADITNSIPDPVSTQLESHFSTSSEVSNQVLDQNSDEVPDQALD